MYNPYRRAKDEFAKRVLDSISSAYPAASIGYDDVLGSIKDPRPEHGDISTSIAFKMAKQLGKNPAFLAESIASTMNPGGNLLKIFSEGGYVNAWFNTETYSYSVIKQVLESGKEYGRSSIGAGKKVIVEFPSVNPNKPWHIGHLRNALLGDSISNIMEYSSYKVWRIDYIDDLGLQMAESVWGYRNISSIPDKKFDRWLGEQYVEVNLRLADESVKGEIEATLARLEDKGTEEARLSREIVERCVAAQYETAFKYLIAHDALVWESDIVESNLLGMVISLLKEKGIAKKRNEGKFSGCTVIDLKDLEGHADELKGLEESTKVLVRANGAATYIAKDIAFHLWKLGFTKAAFNFKDSGIRQVNGKKLYTTFSNGTEMQFGDADMAVNIIDAAQRHQQLILKAAVDAVSGRTGGHREVIHLQYGQVGVELGSLSGRKGGWIGQERSYTADDLHSETVKKALEIIQSSMTAKHTADTEKIANAVALAAIKFEFMRVAPEKGITFSWENALSFEGNSGPYCMYTYARAAQILMKETPDNISAADMARITSGAEFELIKLIGGLPDAIELACENLRPNILVEHLLSMSAAFSRFYENSPILKGGDAKNARLLITKAFMQSMYNLLMLIGVNPMEKI
jgi:arginyl-tRNA synthetase